MKCFPSKVQLADVRAEAPILFCRLSPGLFSRCADENGPTGLVFKSYSLP